jgi:Biotin carboxylase C-terminal domain
MSRGQVVVHCPTFLASVQKMQRALYEFQVRGVKTNILFLENVLRHPEFLSGAATTSFIDRNPQLFSFSSASNGGIPESSKLLEYLAELVCLLSLYHHYYCYSFFFGGGGASPQRDRESKMQVFYVKGFSMRRVFYVKGLGFRVLGSVGQLA